MSVKRIYVEKKTDFAVKAHELKEEIDSYLGIKTVGGVRVLIRYDIENISESQNSFPDKIHAVLDYVEQNFDDIRGFCMLVRIGTGSYEISEPLKNEYERMQETFDCHRMDHLIDRMIEQGRQEGILTENNTFLCRMAFASQMMMYTAALLQQEKADLNVPETEKLKTFVYHALVKSLN